VTRWWRAITFDRVLQVLALIALPFVGWLWFYWGR
jgi:hypothetical protein